MHLPKYKYYLASIDFLIVLISFYESRFAAFLYRGGSLIPNFESIWHISYSFIVLSFIFAFIFVLMFQNNNLYKINVFLTRSAQLTALIKSIFYGVILLIIFSFVAKFSYIVDSRVLVASVAIITTMNLTLLRVGLLRSLFLKHATQMPIRRKVAIVGAGESGKLLGAKINFEEIYGLEFIGFIDDKYEPGTNIFAGKKNLGHVDDLEKIKKENEVEELIISIDKISYENLLALIDRCNKTGVNVKLNSLLFNIVTEKIATESYFNVPVIEVSPRINKKINFLLKRIVDIMLSTTALVLLSPLLIFIAVAIKASSKGPVFYKQIRVGRNGKQFQFYKFRSMSISNEEDNERKLKMIEFMKNNKTDGNGHTKIINEGRLTWIGRFIRKTSLDELPQLLNVMMGRMSLVGPRPCLPYEWENYDNWQKRRAKVLPGCTGVWQVSGRSNVSFNDSVVLDLYYINNMSPWLDLQLIIKTIPVMIFGRGGK